MTHRSRSGGPVRKRGGGKQTHTRKLNHPALPPPVDQPAPPKSTNPLPPSIESGPFNPPDSEVLALLHRALHTTLSYDEFVPTVQRIKGLLRDKKWLDVFCGTEGVLESYAGRWVPSRACCFRELMDHLVNDVLTGEIREESELEDTLDRLKIEEGKDGQDTDSESVDGSDGEAAADDNRRFEESEGEKRVEAAEGEGLSSELDTPRPTHHILSLGGGAGSELLSITALIRSVLITRPHHHPTFTWTGIDIGNWHGVLRKLEDAMRVDWKIDEDILKVDYIKGDLLAPSTPTTTRESENDQSAASRILEKQPPGPIDLAKILQDKPPKLTTLLFTLTELLSQSRPATISLLRTLTANTPVGGLFLVVDSASDISEFSLGAEGRKWPVWMIVDALLVGQSKGWEKVREEDSRWFRFDEGVGAGWTVKLENTRYWYRLYRRV